MTTVAWDGKTLAADKQGTYGGMKVRVTKIERAADGRLIGHAGSAEIGRILHKWIIEGGERPAVLSSDDWTGGIEIRLDGSVWRHEKYGCFQVEQPFFAIGSGREFAVAAMDCGKTAAEAIEIASHWCTDTGMGIDTLELKP